MGYSYSRPRQGGSNTSYLVLRCNGSNFRNFDNLIQDVQATLLTVVSLFSNEHKLKYDDLQKKKKYLLSKKLLLQRTKTH